MEVQGAALRAPRGQMPPRPGRRGATGATRRSRFRRNPEGDPLYFRHGLPSCDIVRALDDRYAAMSATIGFLGGTGIEGRGLALRFALAGADVVIGSRSQVRAQGAADAYNRLLGNGRMRGLVNREMLAACDLVFLTLPFDQAPEAVEALGPDLRTGTIVVDVTVPMRFVEGRAEHVDLPEGSSAEHLAARLRSGIALVGAFKTLPAHVLADLETPLECDVFVCGDSSEAKERVMETARMIPTLRPLDAGPLRMARTLERMTGLAVHLNRRYRKRGARYRVQGL